MGSSRTSTLYLATVPLVSITINLLLLSTSFIAVKEFNATHQTLGYIGSGVNGGYAVLCLVCGWLLAHRGPRFRLIGACVLYVLISIAATRVGSLWQFCALAIALALPGAIYWPTIEHVISAGLTRRQMRRSLGSFNVLWSTGLMCGTLLAGLMYKMSPRLPFYAACATSCALLVVFVLAPAPQPAHGAAGKAAAGDTKEDDDVPPARVTAFLYLSRVMNMLACFTLASLRFLFPKYGEHVGFDPLAVAALLFVLMFVQTATFLVLRNTGFWHYRFWPLVVAPALAAGSFFLAGAVQSRYVVIAPLFFCGVLMGLCYTSSIYYSMARPQAGVESAAWHEMTVGTGGALGPIAGGYVADRTGDPRTPFVLSGIVALIAFGVALRFRIRSLRNSRAG